MWVSAVQLENFRNYEQLSLSLTQGFTLFFGENGEGKTNLVESVGYLANFQSHRVAGYQNLIRQGQSSARISATVQALKRSLTPAVELNSGDANRFWLNGNQQKKLSDLAGVLRSVHFAPEDLDIIRRDPSDRRAFLDTLLLQLRPRLAGVKSDYERVLKQRNALLKSARQTGAKDLGTLDIWDDQLVALGSELIAARVALVSMVEPLLAQFYAHLTDKPAEIGLSIQSSINPGGDGDEEDQFEVLDGANRSELADAFRLRLAEVRSKELERGITLVGPHRDELRISLDGLVARAHASQGEAWSLALGAKLAVAELMRADSDSGDPVIVLDDVFSVLDPGRRERLVAFVSKNEQVLITATSAEGLPDIAWAAKHRVHAGIVDGSGVSLGN